MKSDFLLSFYADTPSAQNVPFTWRIYSPNEAPERLKYFLRKGYKIRAAWVRNRATGMNQRVDIPTFNA